MSGAAPVVEDNQSHAEMKVPRVRDRRQHQEVPLATYPRLQVPRGADASSARRLPTCEAGEGSSFHLSFPRADRDGAA
jgi:hypothetical protein